ncbi:dihydrofolate reductase [Tepiditoga spiralis]|uniref:dihydrofolate reductase n=1 Tax=Tepiditoga spiralis TaxID=2108365 RepID=A0A7G1G9E7_9BACT|nr:dihydrofolate reductase [Tepiditoga spiralis]BBE29949.1 dihydrofolate reductase [Tepiditoga spiralis]
MILNLIMVSSINGIISKTEIEKPYWNTKEDLKFFSTLTKKSGVVIMGRKTFETIGKALPERLNIVMTKNPQKYKNLKNLKFINDSPENILKSLKNYSEVFLIGGSTINSLFLEKNLIDYIYLTIEPWLINGKITLFKDIKKDIPLILEEIKKLNDSTIVLKYKIKK